MQKVTAILEKNVEWVALGIAGLFFLWMIYGFVVEKPVAVAVGPNAAVSPGEVDPLILNGPAKQVGIAMDVQQVPTMVVVDFTKDLNDQLSGKNLQAIALQDFFVGPANPIGGHVEQPTQQQPTNVAALVTDLPKPPAPISLQTSQGRSNIQIQLPGGVAAQPANGQPVGVDRNWVSVSAVVPMQALAQEFANKKIPQLLNTTTLLRVELEREEQQPDGSWGSTTIIPPLLNVTLQPLPPAKPPAGQPINVFVDQANGYTAYAEKDQKNLIQPDFYKVLQADPWLVPGQLPAPAVPLIAAAFDPATFHGDASKLPDDQKKMYLDYRRAEEARRKQEAAQKYRERNQGGGGGGRPGGGPPGGYRGGGGGGAPPVNESTPLRGYSPAANDADRPLTLAQAYRPPQPVGPEMNDTEATPYNPGGQALPPGAPPIGPLPQGSFDPAALAATPMPPQPPQPPVQPGQQPAVAPLGPGDVTIWAHDDSAQPGHTYRYHLRYMIRNPVFASHGATNPQTLAETFILESAWSDWTPQVNVKSDTNFFATGTSPAGSMNVKAKFDIFRFKNGAMQKQSVEVTPGDMVGGPQGAGGSMVDFTTGLTLIDVRSDPKNPENRIIILSGDNGQLVRHDLAADRSSEEYKKLLDQVNAAAAKPVAAAGGAAPLSP